MQSIVTEVDLPDSFYAFIHYGSRSEMSGTDIFHVGAEFSVSEVEPVAPRVDGYPIANANTIPGGRRFSFFKTIANGKTRMFVVYNHLGQIVFFRENKEEEVISCGPVSLMILAELANKLLGGHKVADLSVNDAIDYPLSASALECLELQQY